jgi:outer membrane protein OmpA-like peptidoglycan-associated protein
VTVFSRTVTTGIVRRLFAVACIIFQISPACSQIRDTIYSDSIVRRFIATTKEPISILADGGYFKHVVSEGVLPRPLSTGCDTFTAASSSGPAFSASLAIPLNDDLYVAPFLSYHDLQNEHTYGEFFTDTTRTSGGDLIRTTVPFEHTIVSPAKAIGLGLSFGARFFQKMFGEVGVEVLAITDRSFEKHLQPNGPGGFSDGSRDSLEVSGELPRARSILPSLRATIGAEFPLSSRLFASPILAAHIPLTGLTPYWNLISVGGGIRLRYVFAPQEQIEEYIDTIRIPTIVERPQPKPKLQAEIRAVGISTGGIEEEVIRLDVEEVKARVALPMLNYIFFNEGSAEIPSRYQQFPTAEDAKSYFKGTTDRRREKLLDIYTESLNIIGSRLSANPAARITLVGSTSNTGREKNALDLAQKRAETIKNYLVRIWNIAADRIKIQARLLPEKPSPSRVAQGEEENRRVEIISNDDRITDPIIVTNLEHLATPSEIKLRVKINAEAGVKYSVATISIAGNELVRYEGTGLARQKAWAVTEEALSASVDSLDLRLEVTDSAGNTTVATGAIPLVRRRAERERPEALERYSLILFGFDEDVLGKKNERIVKFVGETFKRLQPERVTIIGYTDELGDMQHNDDLSRRRAEAAAQALERTLRELRIGLPAKTVIEGRGSHQILYDNSLPEGRFFSRTVNVTIEKRE